MRCTFARWTDAADWKPAWIVKFACLLELDRLSECAAALLRQSDMNELAVVLERVQPPQPPITERPYGPNCHIFETLWRLHAHDS